MTAVAEATGWYVYGVIPAAAAARVGMPAIEEGDLAALVACVSLSEYGEDVLPERLNDPNWLEAQAQAHNDLLQGVAATAPVVPFRFGTIYREVDDLRAMLHARKEELEAALERVAGRVELGVKVWAAQESPAPAAVPAASTGRAYLEQRLGARDRAHEAAAALADAAADAHARLLAVADDGVANRPQPRELTGRSEAMILNGAYLVGDPAPLRAEVERLAGELAGRGITLEVTGPWPPYNFVSVGGAA